MPLVMTLHPRWVWFGVGAAAASLALSALAGLGVAARGKRRDAAAIADALLTVASAALALGVIVLTAVHGVDDLRWWAFGLGSGMVGASLVGSTIHELSSERVRHELEVAHATTRGEGVKTRARPVFVRADAGLD